MALDLVNIALGLGPTRFAQMMLFFLTARPNLIPNALILEKS